MRQQKITVKIHSAPIIVSSQLSRFVKSPLFTHVFHYSPRLCHRLWGSSEWLLLLSGASILHLFKLQALKSGGGRTKTHPVRVALRVIFWGGESENGRNLSPKHFFETELLWGAEIISLVG